MVSSPLLFSFSSDAPDLSPHFVFFSSRWEEYPFPRDTKKVASFFLSSASPGQDSFSLSFLC